MTSATKKICFVIMGFGKKTDFETGRLLDLDATYEAIIRPAVETADLKCIRADEIAHSGIIDTRMFEMLLRAELVIADISTSNANALYELGVRHGLRPNSTIIMKEEEGRLYFDLDHINTVKYRHLGEDIGAREANRAKGALLSLINSVLSASAPDSPVYTYLPKLQQPRLSEEEVEQLIEQAQETQESLSALTRSGERALKNSQPAEAAAQFSAANAIKPDDPYITQRLALATYKAEEPTKLSALIDALKIISRLSPDTSNDPETLGITGAIHKRIWRVSDDLSQLDMAIRYYQRGFELKRDYYNGENLATCLNARAKTQADDQEKLFDEMSAKKVRLQLIDILKELVAANSFSERNDRHWIYATLANTCWALGFTKEATDYEQNFFAENPAQWERETYETEKKIYTSGQAGES